MSPRKFHRTARWRAALALCGVALFSSKPLFAAPPALYPLSFSAGSPEEIAYLFKDSGSQIVENVRRASLGSFWVYAFPALGGARCRLVLKMEGDGTTPLPAIEARGSDTKPIPSKVERNAAGEVIVEWTNATKTALGAKTLISLGAKNAPFGVLSAQFTQTDADANNDGLPDSVEVLLRQGYPADAALIVQRPPAQPQTVTQTPRVPTPDIDLQTDSVFVYNTSIDAILGWKERGYTVWTMGGSRDSKEYAQKNQEEQQKDKAGNPITIEGSHYFSPTDARIKIEQNFFATALANGSEGVCPEEPEYWARAGYEEVFKAAWQKEYSAPWEPPHGSLNARWKASRLMANLQQNHIRSLLSAARQQKPQTRRFVALHSPLNYAQWGIVSPQYAISSLEEVQEVIGQVWTGTSRSPIRYNGLRSDRNFSLAYLEYSSLYHLLRGTGKRLWFLMDPLEDDPARTQEDYKAHYEETLVAALLFPEVNAYEVMPWPERVYGRVPQPYATEINSVIAALQEMHTQTSVSGNALGLNDIGVFASDSLQWQREAPEKSDFDGVFGLTLPLLQHGIPVQVLSLDRAADPGYLKNFKTLVLSYDFQKPPSARVHTALREWVRNGGSLLFVGGSDAYNALQDSWWRKANLSDPQADLWAQLGIQAGDKTTRRAVTEANYAYKLLQKGDPTERNLQNRRKYTLELTPFTSTTGSVAVRFADASPEDGWGANVTQAELRVGGQIAISFRTGSDIENRFLSFDNGSQTNGRARFADGSNSWTYQFDNLPRNQPITLTVEMGNGFSVSAASVTPDTGHSLIGNKAAGEISKTFPRLRVGAAYPLTSYPKMRFESDKEESDNEALPKAFYTLREGGTPIWEQSVGKGVALSVGVAPGFFSASERSAGLYRNIVQYAYQRAGGTYVEADSLVLKRGRYTVVRTLGESVTQSGRTLDVLSPTLAVTTDRVVPANSVALLCELPAGATPRLAFASGRVQARIERPNGTAFFARGPSNTTGAARLWAGGKTLSVARGADRYGNPVAVEIISEGSTVLLRYPNHPDGVIVRVAWE